MTQSELDLPRVVVDHDMIVIDSLFDTPDSFLGWRAEHSEWSESQPECHWQALLQHSLDFMSNNLMDWKTHPIICVSEHLWVAEVDDSANWWLTCCSCFWMNNWFWTRGLAAESLKSDSSLPRRGGGVNALLIELEACRNLKARTSFLSWWESRWNIQTWPFVHSLPWCWRLTCWYAWEELHGLDQIGLLWHAWLHWASWYLQNSYEPETNEGLWKDWVLQDAEPELQLE